MADAEWIGRDAERLAVILDALKLAAVVEYMDKYTLETPINFDPDEAFAALYGEEER